MIINNSIKVSIIQTFKNLENSLKHEEVLATEILFYKFIIAFINSNPEQKNNITNLILTYSKEYQTQFISLKNVSTSYQQILLFLKKIHAKNLLSINEEDINTVYNIYVNGKKVVPFSTSYFSELMYNIGYATETEINYLKHIHFNIMVKIYNYYHNIYHISEQNFKIDSADSITGNTGKVIYFYIDGVPLNVIYSDLMNKRIPIYGYTCSVIYPYIKFVTL